MTSDERDAVFSVESPEMEEDGSAGGGGGGGGGGETDSDEAMPEPNEPDEDDPEYEDLNSPLISTAIKSSSSATVTVALPSGSAVPVTATPVDSDHKWHHRTTEIVHLRPPPIDDSRRLFQRLWTDEDEIELLRGFLDYVTCHRGTSSHPPDTAPFYELIKSKLQLEFNKNQLVEKLRRLKKKYRNVMSKISSGKEVVFKSGHDQATFDISRKIWNQTGKIIGFEDNNVMEFEETNGNASVEVDNENVLEKKVSGSRKRSRSRIGKVEEDKPVALSDGVMASGGTNVNLNENVSVAFGELSDGRSLGGLIEETVKSCVSPLVKEMMNGATGMMMAAVGGFPGGGGHAMGVLSPMLMPPVNLGIGGGKGVGDERWRRQQILELEVYSRRLELVQEQIRAAVNELKAMPSGG